MLDHEAGRLYEHATRAAGGVEDAVAVERRQVLAVLAVGLLFKIGAAPFIAWPKLIAAPPPTGTITLSYCLAVSSCTGAGAFVSTANRNGEEL